MSGGGKRIGIPNTKGNKRDFLAIKDLERLGANPIEEIWEALQYAKKMTIKGGNWTDKGTDHAVWGGIWLRAATDLAKFKHPTLSAIAMKDMTEDSSKRETLTAEQAMKIIQSDPSYPKELKTEDVIDAMNTPINNPLLPGGKGG